MFQYTSENGFTGYLYNGNLNVYNADNRPVFYSGCCPLSTYGELVTYIENFPRLYKRIQKAFWEVCIKEG